MTLNVTDHNKSPLPCAIIALCGRVRQGVYEPAVRVLGAPDEVRNPTSLGVCSEFFFIALMPSVYQVGREVNISRTECFQKKIPVALAS
jgi:hypothetical protein